MSVRSSDHVGAGSMSSGRTGSTLWTLTAGLAFSGAALLLIPDHLTLGIVLPAIGNSTNLLIVPIGYWAAAAAFAWSALRLREGPARETVVGALRVTLLLHVLVLLRTLIPTFDDSATVANPAYRAYLEA